METLPQIWQDILSLAHAAGFREVAEADVVEVLQSPGADQSNEERMGLEQEREAGVEGEDRSPVLPQLTARLLAKALAHVDAGL